MCVQVYYVSRGRIKVANKQFNTTNNNYELSLNEDSEVELVSVVDSAVCATPTCLSSISTLLLLQCTDAASESKIPTIQYNFKPINEIESVEPNTMIGMCVLLQYWLCVVITLDLFHQMLLVSARTYQTFHLSLQGQPTGN